MMMMQRQKGMGRSADDYWDQPLSQAKNDRSNPANTQTVAKVPGDQHPDEVVIQTADREKGDQHPDRDIAKSAKAISNQISANATRTASAAAYITTVNIMGRA